MLEGWPPMSKVELVNLKDSVAPQAPPGITPFPEKTWATEICVSSHLITEYFFVNKEVWVIKVSEPLKNTYFASLT